MSRSCPRVSRLGLCVLVVWGVGLSAARSTGADQTDHPSDRGSFVTTFYFENDGTFVKRNNATDRHYTNGVKITVAHRPDWAARLAGRLPFNPATGGQELKTAAGYAIGQQIYTPQDIQTTVLVPDDRPYAGWLYGGVYLQRATDAILDHFEVNLGVIGPSSQAESIQKQVHDLFDQTDPRGWDRQLGDEFAIDFVFQRKWKIPLLTRDGARAVELIPQAGVTVGTVHRHANVGALVRVGVNLPDDFGPGRIEEPAAATGRRSQKPGGYGFVRVGGKLVEHDTLLEGNNHRSSHGVDPERLFGQVQVGFVVFWGGVELGYSQTFDSRQFKGQRGKDSFGALTVAWRSDF